SSTRLPRIKSTTCRTFVGEMRTWRAIALASIALLLPTQNKAAVALLSHRRRTFLSSVAPKGSRWGKLAQLVSDHIFRDIDGHMLSSIVDCNRMPDKLRKNRRTTRPGPDHPFFARLIHLPHFG